MPVSKPSYDDLREGFGLACIDRDRAEADAKRQRDRAIAAEQQLWRLKYGIRGALEHPLVAVAERELRDALNAP